MDFRPPPYAEFRFAFYARDFDASVKFYQEQLGFLPIGGWDRPDGRTALLNAAFGAVVEIYEAAPGRESEPPSSGYTAINLAVRLESPAAVDQAYRRLEPVSRIDDAPQDRPWGHRSFTVRDPDGIAVYLFAELTPPVADPPGALR